jgi:hypothetical protein
MSKNSKKHSDKILQISPNVDMAKIKQSVQKLKVHKDKLISELDADSQEQYKILAENSDLLHQTKYYKSFIETIHGVFADVKEYHPNTVGAYLNGCSIKYSSDVNVSCMPSCAGSIQNYTESEKKDSWSFSMDSDSSFMNSGSSKHGCGHLVLLAEWCPKTKSFKFVDLNSNEHTKNTYIHTSFDSVSSFPGFSKSEKEALEKYGDGVQKVNLMSYDKANNQKELLGGWVTISELPTREANGKSGSGAAAAAGGAGGNGAASANGSSSTSSSAVFWFFVIIVIIILICLLIYMNNKN